MCTTLFKTIDERNTNLLKNLANDTFNEMNVFYDETNSFNEDTKEESEFNTKYEYYDILSDCKKTSRGELNKLYTEIVNNILDKIKK